MSAVIYQISGGDKCLILDTRQQFIYPFAAPNWTDLRVGFYVSLCKATNNADPTGLAETLTTVGQSADRFFIGLKDNNTTFPNQAASHYMGFTNAQSPENTTSSQIVSTDVATGATNSNYWRATSVIQWRMMNGLTVTPLGSSANCVHFPQVPANIGGNAAMLPLRFTRAAASTTISMSGFLSGVDFGFVYDSSCLISTMRSAFRTITWNTMSATFNMGVVPDSLYFYWPFNLSKLRIHAVCIEKFA
jgi:hypothetical protein